MDYFLDHNNTALYPTAYMSVPTGPAHLPQEGDGRANGDITPMYAMASWDLTGASASAGTLSIMGATVSGLTASGSALATAIATAINASTASAASVTNGNISAVYLKAVVWAQAVGVVLNVYTRIASDRLNYSVNSACAIVAGTGWTAPPSLAQFSGGVSGPWRYFANEVALAAAVAASNTGALTLYGGWRATVMSTPLATDIVHIRTSRDGSNITCRYQSASNSDLTVDRAGTWRFDGGTKWAQGGVFKCTLASSHGSVGLGFANIGGKIEGNGQRLHVLFQDIPYTFTGVGLVTQTSGKSVVVDSVLFEISSLCALSSGAKFACAAITGGASATFRRCTFKNSKLNAYYPAQFGTHSSMNSTAALVMEDCDIVFSGLLSAPSGRLFYAIKSQYGVNIQVRNVRIYDENNLATRFPLLDVVPAVPTASPFVCQFENVGGISVSPSDLSCNFTGSFVPTAAQPVAPYNYISIDSKEAAVNRLETPYGYVDSIPNDGRPTLAGLLPNGTPWSVRALWFGQYLSDQQAFTLQSSMIYDGVSAVKTITAELLFDGDIDDADVADDRITMSVSYMGDDGRFYVQTTEPLTASGSQLVAGSAGWNGLTGIYAAYKPRKLVITTDNAVAQYSDIEVTVSFIKNCPTATAGKHMFFDPEFRVE